jgi:hypothetical protein
MSKLEDRSDCCQATVTIGGDNREGTHYYVCSKCNNICDLLVTNTVSDHPVSEELEQFEKDLIKSFEECIFNDPGSVPAGKPNRLAEVTMHRFLAWHQSQIARERVEQIKAEAQHLDVYLRWRSDPKVWEHMQKRKEWLEAQLTTPNKDGGSNE